MGQQSIRQQARRAALDAQSKRRRERAEREKRLEGLAVRVLVAMRERDAAVADADRRAGEALREMIEDEVLSAREAVEWCGDEITIREATRLRRLAENGEVGGPKMDDKNSVTGTAEAAGTGPVARTKGAWTRIDQGGSSDGVALRLGRAGRVRGNAG